MAPERVPDLDLYEELEVSRAASRETIEAAYRSLAKRYHPDVSSGPDARRTDRVKRINVARDWLTDPSRRARYDATLGGRSTPPMSASTPGGGPTPPSRPTSPPSTPPPSTSTPPRPTADQTRRPAPPPPSAPAWPFPTPAWSIHEIPWTLLLYVALAAVVLFPTALARVGSEELVFGGLLALAVVRLLRLRRTAGT